MASRRLWMGALFAFVFGDALVLQTRGALLPSFQSSFGASESLLGLVAPAGTVGFVLAVLVVGFAAGRIHAHRAILLGTLLTGVCLLLASGAWSYWLFLLFVAGQGTATGVVRALDRPILGHLYPDRRGRLFSLHALAWAVGAVCGPILVSVVLSVTGWRATYVLLGVFFLPLGVLLWRLDLPGDGRDEEALSLPALLRLARRPPILGMGVALALAGAIEGVVFTWLPYYATGFTTRELAPLLLSLYLLAYLPGRLVYSVLADSVSLPNLVVGLAAGAVPAFWVAFGGIGGWGLAVAVFVAGLCMSGFFPLVSALGVNAAPAYSGPVNAIAVAGTYGGLAVGPVIVGVLAERTSIETAMTVPVVLGVGLLVVLVGTRVAVRDGGRRV